MTAFSLTKHPSMILAPGASKELGVRVTETTGEGSRVLMVCDPALVKMGLAEPLVESLKEQRHEVILFDDLQSDPKEKSVNDATRIAHENQTDCIVGMGGGSALDTSKVVAALAHTGESCEPYRLALSQLPFRKTGLITLPTTAGTGSETTGTSIISQPDGVKNWFWGPPLKPDMALMDPELTIGLPAYWTLYTGLDALVHSIESRTNRYRYEENDRLAEEGIVQAVAHLVEAVKNPTSIEARTGMMLAAAYGGLAIANTGCAVAHNIGHALGSLAQVPHGRAVSVALAQTMEWTIEGNPKAFERVAELLGGKKISDISDKLHGLAEACGESLTLSSEEKSRLSQQTLADDMVADANIAMLEATARDATRNDVEQLAERVMAA
ncbi:MAG: iron-containing alcohol dehydrogenase [Rhizobiaceae bacterium]|nr:iron-containing alcohol dehydrogenase [Rhizobiaceae bacterium]